MSSKLRPFVSGNTKITKMAPVYKENSLLVYLRPENIVHNHKQTDLPKKQQNAKTNIHPCIPIHITTIGKHLIITNAIIHEKQKQIVAPIDRI